MDKHNSKLARWSCQLSEYAFGFVWKCGESMIEPDTLSRAPLPASPDEPTPLSTPLATNLQDACKKMLATPRPANATPMSAEKARVVAIEWRAKTKAKVKAFRLAKRAKALAKATTSSTMVMATEKVSLTLPTEQAVVAKNSAYCPDRPLASEEITDGLPMAWSSPQDPPPPRVTVHPAAAIWEATSWWAGYHHRPYTVRDSP